MKRSAIRWWVILGVILVVYNVVVFVVPFPKTAVFFLSWAFTLIAIAVQTYVVHTAFGKGPEVKSKFYGFPIFKIGVLYLGIQLVLGLVFMGLEQVVSVRTWIPLVLYIVLLGVFAIGLIAVDATRDEVERQDTKLKKDVSHMRTLQSQAARILAQAQAGPVQKAAEQFAEELRFSDPVSSESLREIELDLSVCTEKIQKAIIEKDNEHTIDLLEHARALLAERNQLCKLRKSEKNG